MSSRPRTEWPRTCGISFVTFRVPFAVCAKERGGPATSRIGMAWAPAHQRRPGWEAGQSGSTLAALASPPPIRAREQKQATAEDSVGPTGPCEPRRPCTVLAVHLPTVVALPNPRLALSGGEPTRLWTACPNAEPERPADDSLLFLVCLFVCFSICAPCACGASPVSRPCSGHWGQRQEQDGPPRCLMGLPSQRETDIAPKLK